jgi:hypothetical protein
MSSVTFVASQIGLEQEVKRLNGVVKKLTEEVNAQRAARGDKLLAVPTAPVELSAMDAATQARTFQSGLCTIRIVPLTGPVKMNPDFAPAMYAGATPLVGPAKTRVAATRKPLVSVPNKVASAFSDEEVDQENVTRFQLLELK